MATRPIDLTVAAVASLPAAPLCLLAAAGIWLADGAPVLYKSRRVGLGGQVFTMYKLRTMRTVRTTQAPRADQAGPDTAGLITGDGDRRVFPLGAWLRRWKIDELPQLLNVLRGDMAIVGPRPEDPAIVARFYGPLARETLMVRPGLASPGSIYNFTHGEQQLLAPTGGNRGGSDRAGVNGSHRAGDGASDRARQVDAAYVHNLLPRKLALDLVYVRAASVWYDTRIVARALVTILARGLGRRSFPDPPEMPRARALEGLLRRSPRVGPAEMS